MKIKISIVFLIVLSFLYAISAFSIETNDLILQSNKKSKSLNSPAVATLWGGYRRFKFFNENKGELIKLKSSQLKNGEIEIYLRKIKSNKLILFMPGIFGSIQKGLTPHMIEMLENFNTNLLVLPNLLSPEHIKAHPLYSVNPIETETMILNQALEFSISFLKDKNLEIHVIAESLGTIIASAWVSKDQEKTKRIRSLTLLWPPFELSHAMKEFDKIVREHKSSIQECNLFNKVWPLVSEIALKEYPDRLSQDEELCLGSIVLIDGFMAKMKKSWEAHAETVKSNKSPPESFEDFFKNYRQEFWDLLSTEQESTKLKYWLKRIKTNSEFPISIFTSTNDFLNKGLDLNNMIREGGLNKNELVLFPWGGHSGPIGMTDFSKILFEFSPAFSKK